MNQPLHSVEVKHPQNAVIHGELESVIIWLFQATAFYLVVFEVWFFFLWFWRPKYSSVIQIFSVHIEALTETWKHEGAWIFTEPESALITTIDFYWKCYNISPHLIRTWSTIRINHFIQRILSIEPESESGEALYCTEAE